VGTQRLASPLKKQSWLLGMKQMVDLSLEYNLLSGTLPELPAGCGAHLEILGLSNNAFVGTVRASYARMTNLTQIYLWNNPGLVGCLPKTWKQQLAKWHVNIEAQLYGKTQLKPAALCQ
jgi:hypothetical protein